MSSILPDLTPSRSRPPEPLAATSVAAVDGASLSYSSPSPSTRVCTPSANQLSSKEDEKPRRSSGEGGGEERSAKELEGGRVVGGGRGKEDELNRTQEVNDEDEEEEEEWTYPDGGRKAWMVVLGCFIYAGSTMVSSTDQDTEEEGGESKA